MKKLTFASLLLAISFLQVGCGETESKPAAPAPDASKMPDTNKLLEGDTAPPAPDTATPAPDAATPAPDAATPAPDAAPPKE